MLKEEKGPKSICYVKEDSSLQGILDKLASIPKSVQVEFERRIPAPLNSANLVFAFLDHRNDNSRNEVIMFQAARDLVAAPHNPRDVSGLVRNSSRGVGDERQQDGRVIEFHCVSEPRAMQSVN
jgi:hypothetical protein